MNRALLIASLIALGACAPNPAPLPARTAPAEEEQFTGYLPAELTSELGEATPRPPAAGSAAEAADRAALSPYARMENTPRWTLAQTQAEIAPQIAIGHFDCPLGTRLGEDPPPALVRLFSRALEDVSAAARVAKAREFRARPFVDDPAVRTCIRVDDGYRTNSSAPSSHATAGIVFGHIMADAAPDQREALMRIGREIGISRLVCGLHYPADVEAGQALGESLYAAMVATPDYQAEIAQARREVAEARTLGRTNPACAAERLALSVN